MKTEIIRFIVVGSCAACVHITVFYLAQAFSASILLANGIGFCTAFAISYLGHRLWTFQAYLPNQQALLKAFLIALMALSLSEGLVYTLITHFRWPSLYALGCALLLVASLTFILNRQFVFASDEKTT